MVLQILYSSAQIPALARRNAFCIVLWVILIYYGLKWTVGFSSILLFLILNIAAYLCYLNYNRNVCINKTNVSQQVKPHRKAVLITGCDTGFGFQIAKRLSMSGFQVFACCLFPFQNGGKVLSDSSDIHVLGMDVSKDEDVSLALDFVKHHLGENELWAVINNAGLSKGSELEVTSMEKVEEVISVNLVGTIRVTKAFLPLLRQSKGRIINVASAAGRFVMPGFLPYSVSKNAIIWFSDGLRLEVAKFGISVITIEPWIYRTKLSNPTSISSHIEKQWANVHDGIGNVYPANYIRKIKGNTSRLFGSIMNPNIEEVINVMEDAVTCKCPPYAYRPGKLYLNLLLWFICLLPRSIVDYALCFFVFKCA